MTDRPRSVPHKPEITTWQKRLDAPVPPPIPDPASLSFDSLLSLVRDLEARLRAAESRARGAEDALESLREKIKAMIERA